MTTIICLRAYGCVICMNKMFEILCVKFNVSHHMRAIASFFYLFVPIFKPSSPCVHCWCFVCWSHSVGRVYASRISVVSHRKWKMASIKCNDLTDEHYTHILANSSFKWVLHRKPTTFVRIYGKSLDDAKCKCKLLFIYSPLSRCNVCFGSFPAFEL